MDVTYYLAAIIAVFSTLMVITRSNAIHALLYLVVSLLSVALIFFTLGAAFAAALEVIVYAGAIMVLFVFVVMMLNLGSGTAARESAWMDLETWLGPSLLSLILVGELIYTMEGSPVPHGGFSEVTAHQVGLVMYGPYLLCVELASMLLLAALVGAYRLAVMPRTYENGKAVM